VIRGYFDPTYAHPWPRVRIGVLLTEITQDWAVVSFVIDTGASATCLHQADALSISGIDLPLLTDPTRWGSMSRYSGVGGGITYFPTPVRYALLHDDGQALYIDGTINVAQWTPANQDLPSLLGWDVLGLFSLYIDPSTRRLELNPTHTP
jgi:hypothetical protein